MVPSLPITSSETVRPAATLPVTVTWVSVVTDAGTGAGSAADPRTATVE